MQTETGLLAEIEQLLQVALHPQQLEVIDEGMQHIGHTGTGHFYVFIVADVFLGKTWVERHRLVYRALADLMKSKIHALRIEAKAPSEEEEV